MNYLNTLKFSKTLDIRDPLSHFRTKFLFPKVNGKDALYFCGNSLGLQPKSTLSHVEQELSDWAGKAVKGFTDAANPWLHYHAQPTPSLAKIVGALPEEVAVMNTLTANLHFLLVSFYRPSTQRYKIICEEKSFPSDRYALVSHAKLHGFDPGKAIVELKKREGEKVHRTEDIIDAIEKSGGELALVMMSGVNYYNGQFFDMKAITDAGHKAGAVVGFDLAHAAGNVKLSLHDWNVDFAGWCTYKYLNSGPGGVGGAFVHQRHAKNFDLPRLAGWWGNDPSVRFQMTDDFVPAEGAQGWQVSTAQVIPMAMHMASLRIFEEAGMDALLEKRDLLTGYLEFILEECAEEFSKKGISMTITTPRDKNQRGAQLSVSFSRNGKEIFKKLGEAGVIADWREPDVIRFAPVPLYNSFEDVFQLGGILMHLTK
jgi:kynureninase